MTLLTNSFEGSTSGTTISTGNSGVAPDNAFDVVTIGANAACTFDNTYSAHGSLSAKFSTGASSVSVFVRWSTSLGTVSQVWFRFYAYFTANPAAIRRLWLAQGGVNNGSVNINATGNLEFHDTNDSLIFATTNAVNLNGWFRVEGTLLGGASGSVSLSLYNTPDSVVPTETISQSAVNTGGTTTNVAFGSSVNATNVAAFWLDDIGMSSTGYLGPASPPVPSTQVFNSFVLATLYSSKMFNASSNVMGRSVYNSGTNTMYLTFGTVSSTTAYTTVVAGNTGFTLPAPVYSGPVTAIWTGANGITEIQQW